MKRSLSMPPLLLALLFWSGPVRAELPAPKNPLWKPVRDSVYLQEIEGRLPTPEPVQAVAMLDGVLYAGNQRGVQKLQGDALVPAGGPENAVGRLKTVDGALYAFLAKGLWRLQGDHWTKLSDDRFVDACLHAGAVVIASPNQLFTLTGDQLAPRPTATSDQPILGVASYAETLYVRQAGQLSLCLEGHLNSTDVRDWGQIPPGATTRDFTALGSRLIVATDKGLAVLRGMSWSRITGEDGLCYEDTTCVTPGFDPPDFWIGTKRGAIRAVDGEYQYFSAQRWLPHEKVNAIACGDRVVYLATDGGLGIIRYEPYTLQKKAAWYERWIDEWGMRRLGFISTLSWNAPRKEWVRFISDNDGGWAAHLLNAYCFKYAVTKDPAVREQAVEVFRALSWCEQITTLRGFPARSIATVGEPAELAATGSAGLPSEWNPTADGKWLWKGDTSSDEVDSHVQSTTIFYELAAQGKAKEAAREHLRRISSHIIDHGWVLQDLDGKPTRWARWDPAYFKSDEGFWARGLNGLEALAQVTAAFALTGDDQFRQAKRQLLAWGYQHAVLRQKLVFPEATHFDDRLAFLAFYPLLSYETNPELRSIFRRSLERSWEIKRLENMVWFNYVYGALTGNEMDNDRSLKNLREWPLDCHNYSYWNSHRTDLKVPAGYVNYVSQWKSMSARNLGPVRWDHDFLQLDGGQGGMSISDPSAFLDAYWMARYYGMILAPDTSEPSLLSVEKRSRQLGAHPYSGPQRPDVGF